MPPEYFFPLAGMMFALGWGVIGTIRWYLKARLQAGAGGGGQAPARLMALEDRIAELEERLDFTERALASARGRPAVRGGE